MPCWWGIIPGESKWQEAYELLFPLGEYIGSYSPDKAFAFGNDYVKHTFKFSVPIFINERGYISQHLSIVNGIVEKIETESAIPIADLLREYGIPENIWVRTVIPGSGEDGGTIPFYLALYYPEQRIVALLIDDYAVPQSATIRGCVSNASRMILWSSNIVVTYEDISWVSKFETQPIIEEAIDLSG